MARFGKIDPASFSSSNMPKPIQFFSFEGVTKHYGSIVAVDDVSCVFEGGKTHVLLGSSGCGKTTLLRLILGLIPPDKGWVHVDDRAMSSLTRDELVAQMGYVVLSVDNRGTPGPRGRAWRKSIYRKIGIIAAQDQAAAAEE